MVNTFNKNTTLNGKLRYVIVVDVVTDEYLLEKKGTFWNES